MSETLEKRLLVLTSIDEEGPLSPRLVEQLPFDVFACQDVDRLIEEIGRGVGAVLLSEEAMSEDGWRRLGEVLAHQLAWSDLPVLVLTRPATETSLTDAWQELGNVTLLERPIRGPELVSAIRGSLRARDRQYEIRAYLVEREFADRARALLAAIVESSDDAIVSKSLEGIITSWNTGAERLFGYTAEEAIGKPITILIPKERLAEERRILDQIGRGERIEHFETERVTKFGQRIPLSLTVSPIRDALGRIIGASKVARDITARKQTEAEQEEANRRKDEFLATLAHELRNPLAPIRNALSVMAMSNGTPDALDRMRAIMERQVDHMVRLVDDLLEVSRITRGKIELRKERVEVKDVVHMAIETSKPLVDDAQHQLVVELPPESLALDVDPVRISQVLSNLLNNSARYTARGGQITLSARREGASVVLSVRDTGIGIAKDALSRVFDMFVQGAAERQPEGGLGIGLTLVRSLVHMHGGSVEARSEGVGRGSEFLVRLPLAHEPPPAETPATRRAFEAKLSSLYVLVADDNHDAADSLAMVLRGRGAEVAVVYDGAAALQSIENRRPDVVLLDIGMPRLDGYETARRIRENPALRDVTLIALTGWGMEDDRRRCFEAGFDHYVIKPADLDNLQSVMMSIERANR